MLLFQVMSAFVSEASSQFARSMWLIEVAEIGFKCSAVK